VLLAYRIDFTASSAVDSCLPTVCLCAHVGVPFAPQWSSHTCQRPTPTASGAPSELFMTSGYGM